MATLPYLATWQLPSVLLGRAPIDPDALPSYRLLAVMVALILELVVALGFTGNSTDLPIVMAIGAALVVLAMVCRWREASRTATAIEATVLILAASMATSCLCVLLGTTAFAYRDALLERADTMFFPGARWIDMYSALHRHDRIVAMMCGIYQTLLWQPFVLVATLASIGKERFCWRFVQAWFLTLFACAAVFPFLPAVGPYIHHGLVPADIASLTVRTGWQPSAILDGIRDGSIRSLQPTKMTGMVSFPSFHAAGSVLLFWGFRRVRFVGPAFMVLDVAMCLTAPLIGAHYFIDIAGGIGVALLAIFATRRTSASTLPSPPIFANQASFCERLRAEVGARA